MIHSTPSQHAGKKVKIKDSAAEIGGSEILIEDYWDRVYGKSWMQSDGNPAAMDYAIRTGFSDLKVPTDNEVLYGKIGGLGCLVHFIEIEKII